jgi:predicted HAD superfamily Cof-like phosphohydrolase
VSNFDDVGDFHEKFGLETWRGGPPRELTPELLEFRIRFMLEELGEYCEAVGYDLSATLKAKNTPSGTVLTAQGHPVQDLPKAFDALIDLVYVALGTAQKHRFPWQAGWDEVQRANMAKVRGTVNHKFYRCDDAMSASRPDDVCQEHPLRHQYIECGVNECEWCVECGCTREEHECRLTRAEHSLRGSQFDVIKPPGWTPPDVARALDRAAGLWKRP